MGSFLTLLAVTTTEGKMVHRRDSVGLFPSAPMCPFLVPPAGSPPVHLGYLSLAMALPSSLLWLLLCQVPSGPMGTVHGTPGPWRLPMALTQGRQTSEHQEKWSC